MPAGRTVVLGVSGGIAAYKAIEVCRRLVDAGAARRPGHDRGRHPLRGRGHLLGAGLRAGADLAVGRGRPDPAHAARPARRPGRGVPGHRPADRRLRRRHLPRPAHRHAARHPGAGDRVPGDAHRDVGAPGRAGEPGHAAPPGRDRGRARGRSAGRRRHRRGPPGRPRRHRRRDRAALRPPAAGDLDGLRVLVTAGGTREAIDPVRVITNRSSGKQGYALAERAAARGAKVTLVTTVDRPVAAGHRRGRGGQRGRDGGRRRAPQRRPRRDRHGRRGGRLPARRRRPTARSRRAAVRPGSSSSPPTTSWSTWARPSRPARRWSGSRPRPTRRGQRPREAGAQGPRPDRGQRRLGARRRVRTRHQPGRDHHRRRRRA